LPSVLFKLVVLGFMKRMVFLLCIVCSFLSSCELEQEIELLGKWTVAWEERDLNETKTILHGEINFLKNGLVELTGYGYFGNPYLHDTTQSVLCYQYINDSILTTQMGRTSGLNYKLVRLNQYHALLQLTPEIYLNLSRKE